MRNMSKKSTMSDRTPSFFLREAYCLAKELEQMQDGTAAQSQAADETLCAAETAVLIARRSFGELLEKGKRNRQMRFEPRAGNSAGSVKITREGWTVLRLDTLLQNARRRTTGYIENSLLILLKQWREGGGVLPWYRHAFVIIAEHSDCKNGNAYDPDNREWKAVTNALKGVLFEDDDQFTISLILDTVPDGKGFTEITVLPYQDAAAFLSGQKPG